MSHFYGTLRGSRGEATRQGTVGSGLTTIAASWDGAITVRMWRDEQDGVDRFEVWQRKWHGSGIEERIASGIVGKPQLHASPDAGRQVRITYTANSYDHKVIAEVASIRSAERVIEQIEEVDPDHVHGGYYGVEATEAADVEYQCVR